MTAEANADALEVLLKKLFTPHAIVLSGMLLIALIFFRPVV